MHHLVFVQLQAAPEVTLLKLPFHSSSYFWHHFGGPGAKPLLGGTICQNGWRGSSQIARRSPRTPRRTPADRLTIPTIRLCDRFDSAGYDGKNE
jgi:hypothetical protein